MILAVDVQYADTRASVGAVLFECWQDSQEPQRFHIDYPNPEPYIPGEFYKRELPCILSMLEHVSVDPDTVIVDGHVYLDGHNKPGLGKHLYDALHGEITVIGVAKSAFTGIDPSCEIFRGASKRPLYVSAVSMPLNTAKAHIIEMKGKYRIPDYLKLADQIARQGSTAISTKS
ncbi:MAG: endonuclease V [Pseudomonadota bacterium]